MSPCLRLYSRTVDEWASKCAAISFPSHTSPLMRVYAVELRSTVFRKVHVEYASTNAVELVRCVAFPHANFEVPVLEFDVVMVDRVVVRRARADLCFPGFEFDYWNGLATSLQREHRVSGVVPDDIDTARSASCLYIRSGTDMSSFSRYVVDLTRRYIDVAGFFETSHEYAACHTAYCDQRMKTTSNVRGLMAVAFSPSFADSYARSVFDM